VITAVSTRIGATPSSVGLALSGVAGVSSSTSSSFTQSSSSSSSSSSNLSGRGFSRGLVTVPDVALVDPSTLTIANPTVAEKDRYCANCGEAVGRAKAGRDGRLQGFCPACRQPFDLTPKLTAGEVVAGQYEVVGCLAHGGFGWIYLARDRNVSNRWVVLKGLLDSGNEEARGAALAERQFLATMEHPSIVKIYNFVAHNSAEYIVMEFVGGKSLKNILKERREANGGKNSPLPVEVSITYILGILPALSYLHDHGYVFCDFKPDNMIHQENQLKLIDLGGVRRLGDNDGNVYGTVGFQAPEIATAGPSISSDIYTVVRTLAVLCLDFPGYTSSLKHHLPDPTSEPTLTQFDSLYRFLQRGTATDPNERFQTIDELSDQLLGLLREVVAVRTSTPKSFPSSLFTSDLLAARGVERIEGQDWLGLPLPLISPNDPAASFLTNLSAEPGQLPELIGAAIAAGQVLDSVETQLRVVRAHLEDAEHQSAKDALNRAESVAPTDWRIRWYEGLVALATKSHLEAVEFFDAVHTFWPGELAPRVALAHALEKSGSHGPAHSLYERVVDVDPTFEFAIFGMARCLLALNQRFEAADSYARLSPTSALRTQAQIYRVRILLKPTTGVPTPEDVSEAALIVLQTPLEPIRHAALRRDVLTVAVDTAGAAEKRGSMRGDVKLFDKPFSERSARAQLEKVYRELAALEPDRIRRIELIDTANIVRPRTLF
jgi:serine/threonine-protein kinase PknG